VTYTGAVAKQINVEVISATLRKVTQKRAQNVLACSVETKWDTN